MYNNQTPHSTIPYVEQRSNYTESVTNKQWKRAINNFSVKCPISNLQTPSFPELKRQEALAN